MLFISSLHLLTSCTPSQQVDFPKLLKKVDEGFMTWRKPTALCFGNAGGMCFPASFLYQSQKSVNQPSCSDPFIEPGSTFDFLENKRTNMKAMSIAAKVREVMDMPCFVSSIAMHHRPDTCPKRTTPKCCTTRWV